MRGHVKKAVGVFSPACCVPLNQWLVWDSLEISVKLMLKCISDTPSDVADVWWQGIEQLRSMNREAGV